MNPTGKAPSPGERQSKEATMNTQAVSDLTIRGSPEPRPPTRETHPVRVVPESQPREPAPQTEPSSEELAQATEGLNSFLKSGGSHIQFAMHEKSEELMVEVIDDRTREIIKTIPPKELLDLAAKIGELVGTLLDQRG
jgi:flagellar protein FlaG